MSARGRRRRDPRVEVTPAVTVEPLGAPIDVGPSRQDRTDAATPLIDALGEMRDHLEALDGLDSPDPENSIEPTARAAAHLAHAEIRKQGIFSAVLLPVQLGRQWQHVVRLLEEYSLGAAQGPDPSLAAVSRTRTDVDNYLAYVTDSLTEYIDTGEIAKEWPPPVLRRDGTESWQSG